MKKTFTLIWMLAIVAAFGNHAFAQCHGVILDACAGPELGSKNTQQYLSGTIDDSTADEANFAGSIADVVNLNLIHVR